MNWWIEPTGCAAGKESPSSTPIPTRLVPKSLVRQMTTLYSGISLVPTNRMHLAETRFWREGSLRAGAPLTDATQTCTVSSIRVHKWKADAKSDVAEQIT